MGLMFGKGFLVWQHAFGLTSFGCFDPCEFGLPSKPMTGMTGG